MTSVASGSCADRNESASSSYCLSLMLDRRMTFSVGSSIVCRATVGSIVRPASENTAMILRRCFIVFFA